MPLTQKSCVLTIHDCRWDVRDPLLDRLANTHLEKERERERERECEEDFTCRRATENTL